jgi:hypothetical protein
LADSVIASYWPESDGTARGIPAARRQAMSARSRGPRRSERRRRPRCPSRGCGPDRVSQAPSRRPRVSVCSASKAYVPMMAAEPQRDVEDEPPPPDDLRACAPSGRGRSRPRDRRVRRCRDAPARAHPSPPPPPRRRHGPAGTGSRPPTTGSTGTKPGHRGETVEELVLGLRRRPRDAGSPHRESAGGTPAFARAPWSAHRGCRPPHPRRWPR